VAEEGDVPRSERKKTWRKERVKEGQKKTEEDVKKWRVDWGLNTEKFANDTVRGRGELQEAGKRLRHPRVMFKKWHST